MADIELVIKLPEEVYRYAKRYNVSSMLALREMSICMNAIANGTSLPKGHGRLIDADCIDRGSIKYYPGTGGYMYASKGEIDKLPSVTPQDPILDKIRDEIKQYQSDYDAHGTEYDRTAWKAFNRCLQIIDKYNADKEE